MSTGRWFTRGLLLIFGLLGCGQEIFSPPPGIWVDPAADVYLHDEFDAVKACMQVDKGRFEDLAITIMPPIFPCDAYATGCAGEYRSPRYIQLGSMYAFRHEVVHALLDWNIGSLDAEHQSPMFFQCGIA